MGFQGDKAKKDPRLPDQGRGGIEQEEKPPGNSPNSSGRAAGFSQEANASGGRAASEGESLLFYPCCHW